MPTKKSTRTPHKMIDEATQDVVSAPRSSFQPSGIFTGMKQHTKVLYLVIIVLALVALFIANKGLLIAAVVNGKPIFRWQLNSVLMDRFGKQTLEGMISEALVVDAAKKGSIVVSQADIAKRQADIVQSLGENVKIDDLLKYQGISKADFDNQIRLQLMVQKLLGKDAVISESDIDMYIASNRAILAATEPAALRAEARQALLDAKIGERLQPWFSELKQKAKIFRFL